MGRHLPSRGFELFCVAIIAGSIYFGTTLFFPGVEALVPQWILALMATLVFLAGAFGGFGSVFANLEKKAEKSVSPRLSVVIASVVSVILFGAAVAGGMSPTGALALVAVLLCLDVMLGPIVWLLDGLVLLLDREERQSLSKTAK